MSYPDAHVLAATGAMDKYRGANDGELGAALVVLGVSAERAAKEAQIRDDMIRVAYHAGASVRQLAEISGLGRKTYPRSSLYIEDSPTDCPSPPGRGSLTGAAPLTRARTAPGDRKPPTKEEQPSSLR